MNESCFRVSGFKLEGAEWEISTNIVKKTQSIVNTLPDINFSWV